MGSLYQNLYTPYGPNQAEARYSPQTQQVQVMTHLKPIPSLPTVRQQQSNSNCVGLGAALYADTKTQGQDSDANYDMELGEFVLTNPKNLPPSSYYGSINVAGYTSLNNVTTDDVQHMQVMGLCTAPFKYSSNAVQTGQLSCQISGTATTINNGHKTIPAMSRVMLALPTKEHVGKVVSGDLKSKLLPITLPITSCSVKELIEGLIRIEKKNHDRHGRQLTRAEKNAKKKQLLEMSGLYFTGGQMEQDITQPLLRLTETATVGIAADDVLDRQWKICELLFKIQSYMRRMTIGVALKTTPPGKQLDVCLSMR